MDAAPITQAALLQAARDGATIITPNRRLSRWIERQFDDDQRARGLTAWERADILPYAGWIEREWREFAESGVDAPLALLAPSAAGQLWEDIIEASMDRESALGNGSLMNPADAARDAMAAWGIAHAWHLFPALDTLTLSIDAALFRQWSRQFRAACARHHCIDAATLPDALARALAGSRQQCRLIVAGFDLLTPQQHHLFRAWQEAHAVVDFRTLDGDRAATAPARHVFASEPEEWRACAAWVRARCEANPRARIAVVSPGLARIKPGLARALADAMTPARRLCPGLPTLDPALVNVSLGAPLASEPLVYDALRMLSLALLPDQDVPYGALSALMRSPHVGEGDVEASARATLEAALRELAPLELRFATWRDLSVRSSRRVRDAFRCPRWHARLERVAAFAASVPRRLTLAAWGQQFAAALEAWGFPGDRALDSRHHQAIGAFRDVLASLPQTQAVRERIGAADALKALRRGVSETLFQPESIAGAPVEVLGALESAGQHFDAIWVLGLDEDSWPLPVRPNPFLPAHLQRAAGVPEASPAASRALDARVTAAWLRAAPDVVFSHAQRAHDTDEVGHPRGASELVRDVPEQAFEPALLPQLSRQLQTGEALESVVDVNPAPLPAGTRVRQGAAPLRDQAACAFRAFARHRLGAGTLGISRLRPDSQQRGVLLHRVLHLLWQQLGDSVTLMAMAEPALMEIIDHAVDQALNEARSAAAWPAQSRLRALEAARLRRLVREWLECERARDAFRVDATETARDVDIGGIRLSVRLDRVDLLRDGTRALIDYKTGAVARASWLGPRPDEPQLPLYFATADEPVTALVFARVKRGIDMGFTGYGVLAGNVPGVIPIESDTRRRGPAYASWDELGAEWESSTATLASDLASCGPRLNPKQGAQTCATCDLQGLCRIGAGAVTDDSQTDTVEADDE